MSNILEQSLWNIVRSDSIKEAEAVFVAVLEEDGTVRYEGFGSFNKIRELHKRIAPENVDKERTSF